MPRFASLSGRRAAALVLIAVMAAVPAAAQQPADSARQAALRDFHGPDLEGKDGPLAKAGLDLLVLYHEYQAFREQNSDTSRDGDAFRPSVSGVRVADGRVTIDAIAAGDAEQLRADLEALGLQKAATAGRVVSGQFPIRKVPALATVESLRGVVLSRARTQSGAVGPDQPRPWPAVGPDSAPAPDTGQPPAIGSASADAPGPPSADSGSAPSAPVSGSSSASPTDSSASPTGSPSSAPAPGSVPAPESPAGGALAFLGGLLGVLALSEL